MTMDNVTMARLGIGSKEEAETTDYMGDGVYTTFDGYHVWLRTLEGMRIGLEPSVFNALNNYRVRIGAPPR